MKNLFKKSDSEAGFTLIELLVVIAIIAILSTIVLASLSQARNRALAAKTNSQLSQIPAAVELASNSGTYLTSTGACTGLMWADANSGLLKLTTPASYPGTTPTLTCNSDATSYAVTLTSSIPAANTIYCVDSSAQVRTTNSAGTAYTLASTAISTTAGAIKCN